MSDHWLELLKPGDKVIVDSGRVYGEPRVETVDRVTATQITVGNSKYRRSDGRSYNGDAWSRWYLREATQERLGAAEHGALAARLAGITPIGARKLSIDQLRRIAAILAETPTP